MQVATKDRSDEPRPAPAPGPVRRVRVEDILDGHREVIIQHGEEEYRLRLTSNSKLLLTK